ncbi:MAG: preprotein translocase subunit SecA [Candidatus Woykebacteria bacterium RBG_16_44_10]|uniref:Protein translocase subunit SecA n=1 Tax=Candidatus Woykebacteria bacterium RBG_16_44_10 TaxID=1802597 RepID=A0A1G1WD51_9BACT|nr:MAG: preprotein translocase subunit SecA [Candidatus Woykebacteria bacterium RBG_16_44_10]
MFKFLGSLLDSNEREVNKLKPYVDLVGSYEKDMKRLSDEKLQKKTDEFRKRLAKGESLNDLLPEAYAAVREAASRTIGQRHFDVQIVGGVVLHQGKIAEMKTGEGKTLVSTLPLYLNALTGKGAHLVTVNDYLARRDAEWMGPIYHLLGLSVGVINHEKSYLFDPTTQELKSVETDKPVDPSSPFEPSQPSTSSPESEGLGVGKFLREISRREAYAADITYGTNNEFGFDYLRDNMTSELSEMVQRPLYYAIVDEVDSILIDEARTPLIISSPAAEATEKYYQFAKLVDSLVKDTDYIIDEKLKTASLNEIGIAKVERILAIPNLYEKDFESIHHIEEALKAKTLYHRDKDYVVRDGEVIIVDEFTGRMLPGRRYSEGLHQAIEAKEGVEIQRESRTLATISFQNYFRLYEKLAGMTGTAATSAEEFHKVYSLDVVVIPTNKPMIRKDHPDSVYKTEKTKWQAVVKEIETKNKEGQPVLVGTTSIEKNELLSDFLKRKKVLHEVLNAKNHEREAQIIANAGQKDAVTIATNIAGRGVDIKLGKGVVDLGGLHIVGTERHDARRIDNQLRGRSGRQGDPGSSRFFVSLQDDIMRLFGGEAVAKIMDTLRIPEDIPIENAMVSKSLEGAQTRVEGHNFDIRKRLVDYDDVLNKHREIIYGRRRQILDLAPTKDGDDKSKQEELRGLILEKINLELENIVNLAQTETKGVDHELISKEFFSIIPFDEASQQKVREEIEKLKEAEKIKEFLEKIATQIYEAREKQYGPEVSRQIEKLVLLNTIDSLWINHLEDIDYLREGVGLRGYAARDPLVEYKGEAFKLFEDLIRTVDYETVHRIFKIQIMPQQQQQTAEPISATAGSAQVSTSSIGVTSTEESPVPETKKKIGRNDPCPCGSGLKYKKCGNINSSTHQENMAKAKT